MNKTPSLAEMLKTIQQHVPEVMPFLHAYALRLTIKTMEEAQHQMMRMGTSQPFDMDATIETLKSLAATLPAPPDTLDALDPIVRAAVQRHLQSMQTLYAKQGRPS